MVSSPNNVPLPSVYSLGQWSESALSSGRYFPGLSLGRDVMGQSLDKLVVMLASRTFSTKQRDKLASSGAAMADGSYPIPDQDALRRAIASYGRAKPEDRPSVKAHIVKRAKALGCADMLPDGW